MRSTESTVPSRRPPVRMAVGIDAAISPSVATAAGLSSSWRMDVMIVARRAFHLLRRECRVSEDVGDRSRASPRGPRRGTCRRTSAGGASRRRSGLTPRPSSSSASASAVRCSVPRSMTRATKFAGPAAGRHRSRCPRATWRTIVTAGCVAVCWTSTVAPIAERSAKWRRARDALASPSALRRRQLVRQRLEPTDRSVGRRQILTRDARDVLERDCGERGLQAVIDVDVAQPCGSSRSGARCS